MLSGHFKAGANIQPFYFMKKMYRNDPKISNKMQTEWQCRPWSDCSSSSLIWVYLFAQTWLSKNLGSLLYKTINQAIIYTACTSFLRKQPNMTAILLTGQLDLLSIRSLAFFCHHCLRGVDIYGINRQNQINQTWLTILHKEMLSLFWIHFVWKLKFSS